MFILIIKSFTRHKINILPIRLKILNLTIDISRFIFQNFLYYGILKKLKSGYFNNYYLEVWQIKKINDYKINTLVFFILFEICNMKDESNFLVPT